MSYTKKIQKKDLLIYILIFTETNSFEKLSYILCKDKTKLKNVAFDRQVICDICKNKQFIIQNKSLKDKRCCNKRLERKKNTIKKLDKLIYQRKFINPIDRNIEIQNLKKNIIKKLINDSLIKLTNNGVSINKRGFFIKLYEKAIEGFYDSSHPEDQKIIDECKFKINSFPIDKLWSFIQSHYKNKSFDENLSNLLRAFGNLSSNEIKKMDKLLPYNKRFTKEEYLSFYKFCVLCTRFYINNPPFEVWEDWLNKKYDSDRLQFIHTSFKG